MTKKSTRARTREYKNNLASCRRSQLKIQQMSFMLMAVFIFFILAGLFFIVIETQRWKQEANILEKNKAIELANMLASSAEFTCGSYCVDADRVMVLKDRAAYKNFFGLESLEIRTVFPLNDKEILCTDGNYPNCNLIKIFSKGNGDMTASSFISLCKRVNEKDYVYYKCELAKLIAGYDVK